MEDRARRAQQRELAGEAADVEAMAAAAAKLLGEGASVRACQSERVFFPRSTQPQFRSKELGSERRLMPGEFFNKKGDKKYARREQLKARPMLEMRVPLPLAHTHCLRSVTKLSLAKAELSSLSLSSSNQRRELEKHCGRSRTCSTHQCCAITDHSRSAAPYCYIRATLLN